MPRCSSGNRTLVAGTFSIVWLIAAGCATVTPMPNPTVPPSLLPPAPAAVTSVTPAAAAQPATPAPPQGTSPARVVRVIDGDTIEVEAQGQRQTVRYIGIDTPEMDRVEPFAREATARNRFLVEGKTVYLEKDVSETDRFGRLLRYVYVGDVMVNALLVLEGYAQAATFPPDVKYAEWFAELQASAAESGRGLWEVTEEPESTVLPFVTPTPTPDPDCDPSYPTVCIPPPPPDLDCHEIAFRRFAVRPPDPHRFDGDGNGLGCE